MLSVVYVLVTHWAKNSLAFADRSHELGHGLTRWTGVILSQFHTRQTLCTFAWPGSDHKKSFRLENYKSETTLSKHVWDQQLHPNPNIACKFLQKCDVYDTGRKSCDLCLSEKFHIIKNLHQANLINKRTDIGNKCPHRRKRTLKCAIWLPGGRRVPVHTPTVLCVDHSSGPVSNDSTYSVQDRRQPNSLTIASAWNGRNSRWVSIYISYNVSVLDFEISTPYI